MQNLVYSAVDSHEFKMLLLHRKHKPVTVNYRCILRSERLAQKISLQVLAERLKQRNIKKSFSQIARWERGFTLATVDMIEAWANCLGMHTTIFIYADDRMLIKGDWRDQLKVLRQDKGLSQTDIGRKIGVEYNHLSQWEQNKKHPSEPEIKSWAIALGVEAELVLERI
jgi:transcriptional regulator with XRE-family HTH domain